MLPGSTGSPHPWGLSVKRSWHAFVTRPAPPSGARRQKKLACLRASAHPHAWELSTKRSRHASVALPALTLEGWVPKEVGRLCGSSHARGLGTKRSQSTSAAWPALMLRARHQKKSSCLHKLASPHTRGLDLKRIWRAFADRPALTLGVWVPKEVGTPLRLDQPPDSGAGCQKKSACLRGSTGPHV